MLFRMISLVLILSFGSIVLVQANGSTDAKEVLAKRGLSFELSEKFDYVNVYKGGLVQKDTVVGLAEIGLTLDTQKAGLWTGGEFYVHGTNVHGGLKPTGELVGDLQGVNNDEGPRTTRLYEAWYQHHLFEDRLAILAGLHDLNADFMVSEYAGLYLNGAFGVPTTLTANVGASVYPLAAPAARIKVKPIENLEILAGIYDGDPGDADINEHSTHIALKSQDGLLSIGEIGWHYRLPINKELSGFIKAGAWHHSGRFEDVSAVDENGDALPYDDNYGGYVIIDQKLYREKDEQGLGVFFMGSGAPQNRNTVDRHIAAGFNYTGLIPTRDADVSGIAFTSSSFSNKQRASTGFKRAETSIEGTYQIKISDNISLQPDIQYVMCPSGDPAIKNASVFSLRTEISF